jgi:DNA-directed RNA polymerase subunit RPC12/RpoP
MKCSKCNTEMEFLDIQEMMDIKYETVACPKCGNRFIREMM